MHDKAWLRATLRTTVLLATVPVLAAGLSYVRWEYCHHRLVTVTPRTLYQSATIPANCIADVTRRYAIKTVIDLRDHRPQLVAAERQALRGAGVSHVHLPTPQHIRDEHATAFLAAMATAERPVLVHCHHGQGRSVTMCAVHRIANEGWTNQGAFAGTVRLPDSLRMLSQLWPRLRRFRGDDAKGRFVLDYRPPRVIAGRAPAAAPSRR